MVQERQAEPPPENQSRTLTSEDSTKAEGGSFYLQGVGAVNLSTWREALTYTRGCPHANRMCSKASSCSSESSSDIRYSTCSQPGHPKDGVWGNDANCRSSSNVSNLTTERLVRGFRINLNPKHPKFYSHSLDFDVHV